MRNGRRSGRDTHRRPSQRAPNRHRRRTFPQDTGGPGRTAPQPFTAVPVPHGPAITNGSSVRLTPGVGIAVTRATAPAPARAGQARHCLDELGEASDGRWNRVLHAYAREHTGVCSSAYTKPESKPIQMDGRSTQSIRISPREQRHPQAANVQRSARQRAHARAASLMRQV